MKSFYGDCDKGAQMPGWYFERKKETLKEQILSKENALKKGYVARGNEEEFERGLEKDIEKLNAIEKSKPKIVGPDKDKLAKSRKELGAKISDSMYSRSDMMKGIADAHEECHRNCDPVIPVDKELAEAAQIELDANGNASRNSAIKAWQLSGKLLDENTDAEILRRD